MFDRESIFALQVLDSRNGERGGKGVSKGKFGLPAASYPTIMLSKGSVMVTDRFHLGNLRKYDGAARIWHALEIIAALDLAIDRFQMGNGAG